MSDFKNQMQAVIKKGQMQQVKQNHQQAPIDDSAKRLVDKVFEQLKSIFPAWQYAWKDAKAIDAAKIEWTKAFMESNVRSVDQLKEGFKHARASESDFLPSSGKFIQWCNKSLCDAYPAYLRFVNRQEPINEVEKMTRGEIGYNCRSLSSEKAERLWSKHYKINYQKWIDGDVNYDTPLLTENVAAKPTDTMRDNFKPSTLKSAKLVDRLNKIKNSKG